MEVSYTQAAEPEKIRATLEKIGLTDITVQNFGTSRDVLIRLPLKSDGGHEPERRDAEAVRRGDGGAQGRGPDARS